MTVTQKETLEAMQVLLSAGVPVLLWGDPGTGKTATVERYAVEAGWSMEPLIASLHDPTDFSGLPMRNGSAVVYAPPEWACRVAENAGVSLVFPRRDKHRHRGHTERVDESRAGAPRRVSAPR